MDIKKYIPTALTAGSMLGVGMTAYFTAKATIKAKEHVEEAEKKRNGELEPKEIVKRTWRYYKVPIALAILTESLIASNFIFNKHELDAANSACGLFNNALITYQGKVKELYGEEAHQNVVNAIIAEKADPNNVVYAQSFFSTSTLDFGLDDEETYIFYLTCSDVFFESTLSKVLEAEYHINRNFAFSGDVRQNEMHEFLGIQRKPEFDDCLWYMDDDYYWIDFNHYQATDLDIPEWIDKNRRVLVIDPVFAPRHYDDID